MAHASQLRNDGPNTKLHDASTSQTLVSQGDNDTSRHGKARQKTYVDLIAMRDEMQAAMISTDGAPSISYLATASIIAKIGLRSIIENDESLCARIQLAHAAFDLEQFTKSVQDKAQILLAICVYVRLDLSFLRELMARGFHNRDLPLGLSILQQCTTCSQSEVDKFGRWQHIFEHKDSSRGSDLYQQRILLRDHYGLWSAKLPFLDESSTELGRGSFGTVYRVKINSSHLDFDTSPRTQYFALKTFNGHGDTASIYKQEIENLRVLSERPQENIVSHHSSWLDSKGKFNILFDPAFMNLREMMDNEHPDPEKPLVITSLLQQFRGLAHGLKHIHRSLNGYHLDLKPSNILVMGDPSNPEIQYTMPKFMIGDLGSASLGVSEDHNRGSSSLEAPKPGTKTYGAPEARSGNAYVAKGRPLDMWSLGCILLEVMVWCFTGPDTQPLRARLNDGIPAPHRQQDAFWYQDPVGRIQLRPSVTAAIHNLRETLSESREVMSTIGLIEGLLEIDPAKRFNAEQLVTGFKSILHPEKADNSETSHTRVSNAPPPPQANIQTQRRFWLPWRRKTCKKKAAGKTAPDEPSMREDQQDLTGTSSSSTSSHTTRRRRHHLQISHQIELHRNTTGLI